MDLSVEFTVASRRSGLGTDGGEPIAITRRRRAIIEYRTSIVVLSHNKQRELVECLGSVRRLRKPPAALIVVDNASSDGSAEAVERDFPEAQLISCRRNHGAAGGRNIGARRAETDFIVFLDDDAELMEDALAALGDALSRHPEAGIVCGKTFGRDDRRLMSAGLSVDLGRARIVDIGAGEADRGQHDEPQFVDACGAFAFAIRRSAFERLGGFDEGYNPYGWEDVDLCLRARRAGIGTLYWPAAVFRHKGTRQGRPANDAYELAKGRNFARLLRRHATGRELLALAVHLPFRAIGIGWLLVRRGEGRAALRLVSGLLTSWVTSPSPKPQGLPPWAPAEPLRGAGTKRSRTDEGMKD
jgi:GT2 family glycosyltransferase